MSRIVFENVAQKVIWETELCGQFSDGFWENSSMPWRTWTSAVVEVNSENFGTDIPKWERRFAVTASELWKVVGYRTIGAVRVAKHFGKDNLPYVVENIIETAIRTNFSEDNKDFRISQVYSVEDLGLVVNHKFEESHRDRFKQYIDEAEKAGFTLTGIIDALKNSELYSVKDFNADLKRMKEIQSTQLAD